MYKNLTLVNGVLIAVMVFLNGLLSEIAGPYLSTLIFHLMGLLLLFIIALIRRNKLPRLKEIQLLYFLPGILSVTTTLLNNLCIPRLGITLTAGLSMYGQLVTSGLVEHYGLFGMPVNRFRKEKLLGYSIISLGVIVMIIM
jgi:transporter family-2 protein